MMTEEVSVEVQEKRKSIAERLDRFSFKQLEEVEYLLSTYEKTETTGRNGELPMHFYGRLTGLKRLDTDQVEMGLGIQNLNTYGVAQGGALYTLADVTIGFMVLDRLAEGQKVLTLEMKVNFIKKGSGARLIATPVVLSWGKTIVVAECAITDEAGEIVAKAFGTFFVTQP